MSHYAVAVFASQPNEREFDRLLEPFNESDENYFIFEPVNEGELQSDWEKFKKNNPNWAYDDWIKTMWDYNEKLKTYGSFYNPQAKYDYYTLDGKSYMYELKDEVFRMIGDGDLEYPDFFLKSQLDWFKRPDKFTEKELRKRWRKYSEEGDGFWTDKYYIERYGTVEQYVKEMMRPTVPYAFITPDGVWHAPGRMGWFALSDETAETMDAYYQEWEEWINHGEDCYVSLVDCHI